MTTPQGRTAHTFRQFDTELEELRGLVLKMGQLVVQQIKDALDGLLLDKIAVAKMVQRLLQLADEPDPDAADALALALTFAQETNRFSLSPPKRV